MTREKLIRCVVWAQEWYPVPAISLHKGASTEGEGVLLPEDLLREYALAQKAFHIACGRIAKVLGDEYGVPVEMERAEEPDGYVTQILGFLGEGGEFKNNDGEKWVLDDEAYQKFIERLDAPPRRNEKLRKLLTTKAPWEGEVWRGIEVMMFEPIDADPSRWVGRGWRVTVPGRGGVVYSSSVCRALLAAEDLWGCAQCPGAGRSPG